MLKYHMNLCLQLWHNRMKGVVILPKYLESLWTPKSETKGLNFNSVLSSSAPFYYAMRDTFGFELRYADEVNVDSNTDVVIMFGMPYHNRPKIVPGFFDLNKNIKLIMCPGDLQSYDNKLCFENRIRVFERCDLIIIHAYEYFKKEFPQFLSRSEFMSNYFSPHDRYIQLSFNDNPKMKCLLTGALNKRIYPLRNFVKKKPNVEYKKAVGNDYAKLLNSYYCCIASTSIFKYALTKHFEIPASGSLLLTNEAEDLKRGGFISGKHYIAVTKKNVIKTIAHCLKNPKEYNHIRKRGMEFVHRNHSVINRIERLKTLIEEII